MIRATHWDPRVLKYMQEVGVRTTPCQKKAIERAMQNKETAWFMASQDVTQLLQWIVRVTRTRRVVEVGTRTGLTTLAIGQVLPTDGQIVTLDHTDKLIGETRGIWKEAGCDTRIQVRIGEVRDEMEKLLQDETWCGKTDLVILDTDHKNCMTHWERAIRLVRPGGMIVVGHTLPWDKIANETVQDEETKAIRELNRRIRDDQRVEICMLGISDGLTLCTRRESN